MLKSIPLEVVTTIAHHPMGRELHLRNLVWALQDIPHRVTVMTFSDYGFRSLYGEQYLEVPGVGGGSFDFHGALLPALVGRTEAPTMLMMQQDVLIHRRLAPVENLRETSYRPAGYFSLFTLQGVFCYPRLWEGGYFIPTSLLRAAARDGVSLGFPYRWAVARHRPYLHRVAFHDYRNERFVAVASWLRHPPPGHNLGDKFVDLTLYAGCQAIPWEPPLGASVHFTGPEHTHQNLPDCYERPESLLRVLAGGYPRPLAGHLPYIVTMFLMSGVMPPCDLARRLMLESGGDLGRVRGELATLSESAGEWMTPAQRGAMDWVAGVLGGA